MMIGPWQSPPVLLFGALLLLGLTADLSVLLYLALSPVRPEQTLYRLTARPITGRDVVAITALFALLHSGFLLLLPPHAPHPLRMLANTLAFHWMVLAYVLIRLRRNKLRWAALFGRPRLLDAGIGLLIYLAAIPVIAVHTTVVINLLKLIGIQPSLQPAVEILATSRSPLFVLYLLVLGSLIGPIAEEIFFRGYLMPLLMRETTPIAGLVASSVIFAAAHLHLTSTPTLFVLALACGTAYMVTGSLFSPIVLHAAFNIVNMITTVFLTRS